MQIKKLIEKLESSPKFKSWKENNKQSYLTYIFKTFDNTDNEEWQLGYYDPDTDELNTFIVINENIELKDDQEIFKKTKNRIPKLELDKITIDYEKAQELAQTFQKENYKNEIAGKVIIILQNLENFGNIWNITYVTLAFNTLNIKIDASSGKILEHELSSLLNLAKNDITSALEKKKE
jgi:hypothetical protein